MSGWIGLAVVLAIGLLWVSRVFIFRTVAKVWVVSDRLDQADAIVVLGGGLGVRPAAAAALYQRGISKRILVATAETDRGRHANLNRDMLIWHEVPPTAIDGFSYCVLSTYGEAEAVREWAKSSGAMSVIIPIDIFSARRVRWIFNRILAPMGIRATVYAATPPEYSMDDWWKHEAGWTAFRIELIKYAYYRLRY
jgi:uncharacterized SAM-binding protein YcdF (DUF218 family)